MKHNFIKKRSPLLILILSFILKSIVHTKYSMILYRRQFEHCMMEYLQKKTDRLIDYQSSCKPTPNHLSLQAPALCPCSQPDQGMRTRRINEANDKGALLTVQKDAHLMLIVP